MNITPYSNDAFNKIYNLLFCDEIALFGEPGKKPEVYPWDVLLSTHPAIDDLKRIVHDNNLESRLRLVAARLLDDPPAGELMGVIIEVAMPQGLDTLAAYKDGTARYINHAEKMVIWESRTDASQVLIDRLFQASETVVKQIGPWKKERLPQPENGDVRLNFLVSDGLYFGQGSFEVLSADAMGGPVIKAATKLMIFLIGQK